MTNAFFEHKFGEFEDGLCWYTRKGNVFTVGLTEKAIESLGEIESVETAEEGDVFEMGDVIATIEGTLDSIEIGAFMDGKMTREFSYKDDYSILVEDPLEEGWLLKFASLDSDEDE